MNDIVIKTKGLTKSYQENALNAVDLEITSGQIVGLIGPNGAGKSTLLKALLGLTSVQGDIAVFSKHPIKDRVSLLQDICFIADTATLPRTMKVSQIVDYVAGVHPKFNRQLALEKIALGDIKLNRKISQLSKGMITQVHLALVMAIDAKLLILDEPTLGLDIIHRKQFYQNLLEDYFDKDKTIIIATHQVEEIEHILTDIIFINHGNIELAESMENIAEKYVSVSANKADVEAAKALKPIYTQTTFSGADFIFEQAVDAENKIDFSVLGQVKTPTIADLFVAKLTMQKESN